ncbi:lipoyl synthase [Methylogaea oryzae]|uniref:Lipoyl synthase n=1 Tax=Methylogaea oryzae TaxID=1295382 RepID=A0A8D4VPS7_9GAMM|nr:lipoyl synthase [Methylogaea oryzae]BBL71808.1 lipoyl synthase [Methylogaea oryzae]
MSKASDFPHFSPLSRATPETHERGAAKLSRIPVKVESAPALRKPNWIRVKLAAPEAVGKVRAVLREQGLHSVCEEAACPNLSECFSHGTATFMVLGDICTRRCPFCDVAHGKPKPPDAEEPARLARAVAELGLRYVVVTSVDRDDLRDGGAGHFAACVAALRAAQPSIQVEILTPDFRGRLDAALEALAAAPPDVFNHNLETVPRLYRAVRPGADYQVSLDLLRRFRERMAGVPTKSGLMLGLGETLEEVREVMAHLRAHGCDLLTLGQYLQPSPDHLPVIRYVTPEEFAELAEAARAMGFRDVASGPLVRSSYGAEQLLKGGAG